MKNKRFLRILKQTQAVYATNDMDIYAGYATLYILMSMVPLLMLMISAVNLLPASYITNFETSLENLFPNIPQIQSMIHSIVYNLTRVSGGLVASISAVTSLWSASNGVSAIQISMQKIQHGGKAGMLRNRAYALLYTVIFIALIPALLLLRVLRHSLEGWIIALEAKLHMVDIAGWLISLVRLSGIATPFVMAAVILLTYTYLAGGKRSMRSQLPGAVVTAVAWVAFSALYEFFISRFWSASTIYGSLAAVFLAAMWLRTIITILFYGAALNQAILDTRPTLPEV
ncbi:MAG: YihY/virulence factor BrkB family protein [Oscillospiraceae bacterium]|nr:YihY/virulence factor BrkB family protein [Oscillospiraceae bacterium]